MFNPFFKNKGPFKIDKLLKLSNIDNNEFKKDKLTDIKDLISASKNDITFFHSKKYEILACKTKAKYCITTRNLSNFFTS